MNDANDVDPSNSGASPQRWRQTAVTTVELLAVVYFGLIHGDWPTALTFLLELLRRP
ncbi:hypothetical protein ACFXO7_01415 [Nocardia tengchongensis]